MARPGTVLGITGAFGYIGKRLLKRLESDDSFSGILCMDIADPPEEMPGKFEYSHCDIRDSAALVRIFQDAGIHTAIHLAFIAYPTRDSAFEYDVDVKGTANVLEACEKARVEKLVVASSDCAYGFFEETPDYLPETAPIRPTPGFPYSENKAIIEKMVADFAASNPSCRVTILRPCIVMGPNCRSTTAQSMKQPVIIGVRGYDPIMQFVHEDDTAEAFYLAAIKDVSGAFNLAADEGIRYSDLAGFLGKRYLALPPKLIYTIVEILFRLRLVPFGKAQIDYIRYPLSMDTSKIREILGFSPRYNTRETLRSFMDAAS